MKPRGFQHVARAASDRYHLLSLRERALIALSVLALSWFGWAYTLGSFLNTTQRRMEAAVVGVDKRIQSAVMEQSRLESAKASDPNAHLVAERDRLDAQLTELRDSLGSLLDRFVAPEKMPALLQDVIKHHAGLTLTRMESLPAEPVDVAPPEQDGSRKTPVWIYRHPMRLQFEGRYFDVMNYLAELEKGSWQFGWRKLSYEVKNYPVAEVTLEIETLSREKGWIGV